MALGITNLVLLTTVLLPTADVALHDTERWDVIPVSVLLPITQ